MLKNYLQVTGRPHKGLKEPAKFGLTEEKVIEMIVNGEWDAFLRKWRKRDKIRKIITLRSFICPKCSRTVKNPDEWTANGSRCLHCAPLSRGSIDCDFCHSHRAIEKIADRNICITCIKKLRGMTDAIQRARCSQ